MRFAITITTVVFLSATASATTWHIQPDGSGDAPTIQAGIDSAAVGDTVELADGVFSGPDNRDLNAEGKILVVRSQSGNPDLCVMDVDPLGAGYYQGFDFLSGEDQSFIVEGIKITHGNTSLNGGAVRCGNGSSPTFINCKFHFNYCNHDGGAIYCGGGSSPVLIECEFYGNNARFIGKGGGLNCVTNCSPILVSCIFRENTAFKGGGMYSYGSSPELTGCVFEDNTSRDTGGGLYLNCSSAIIDSSVFSHQSAHEGGGAIVVSHGSTPIFTHCSIVANAANTDGGAFWCGGASILQLLSCTVSENTAGRGGGVFCWGSTIECENTILWGDRVAGWGAEIQFHENGGTATFLCSDIDTTLIEGSGVIHWLGGNISQDPLFCDPVLGDFTLDSASPCLNAPGCGQIGAFGQGCDTYTSVADGESMPARALGLFVSPNPSTGNVTLRYSLPTTSPVPIHVYDIRGRVVQSLEAGAASGILTWDGRGASGERVAPGVYFVGIADSHRTMTTRLTIVR